MPSNRSTHCVIAHLLPWASTTPLQFSRLPRLNPIHTTATTLPNPIYSSRRYHKNSTLHHHHHYSSLLTHQKPQPKTYPAQTTTTNIRTMSDDAYMSFLNKANADLDAGKSQPGIESAVRTETVDVDAQIPPPLASIDAFYVSETDEPFEPVVLKWDGARREGWPGASQLSSLISPTTDLSSSIETLSPSSFDPRNQYASVLRAVRAAANQDGGDEAAVDLKVYRVEVGKSRIEYYVLGLDVQGGRILGVRARAIET